MENEMGIYIWEYNKDSKSYDVVEESFDEDSNMSYKVFYTTDYFNWLVKSYEEMKEVNESLREFNQRKIHEVGCVERFIETIITSSDDIIELTDDSINIVDREYIAIKSYDDKKTTIIFLEVNKENLDFWIKKYDFNNYMTEIFNN